MIPVAGHGECSAGGARCGQASQGHLAPGGVAGGEVQHGFGGEGGGGGHVAVHGVGLLDSHVAVEGGVVVPVHQVVHRVGHGLDGHVCTRHHGIGGVGHDSADAVAAGGAAGVAVDLNLGHAKFAITGAVDKH